MDRRTFLKLTGAGTAGPGVAGCAESGDTDGDTATTSADSATESSETATTQTDSMTSTETPGSQSPMNSATETPTASEAATTAPAPCSGPGHEFLETPDGFHVHTYADASELGGGRFEPGPEPGPRMLGSYDGTLYATIPEDGRVLALPDEDDSGTASEVVTVVSDLAKPHGIEFYDDHLYLALAGSVVRFRMDGLAADSDTMEVLVDDVPRGRFHWTRSIAIHDDRVYLSAGSCGSGNCSGGDEGYLAAVTAFDLDGSNKERYATGLRNAVGLEWYDDSLFATDNGMDDLGPDLPPDEINVVEEGEDYGFPDCYGDNIPVEGTDGGETPSPGSPCAGKATPEVKLQAHVAPLGFGFVTTNAVPEAYRGDMIVALHGSWTRQDPVGYKLLRIPYDGSLGTPEPFVTGWMPEGGSNDDARGRPVDVHAHGGAIYVSDDMAGEIHRICYSG